MMGRGLGKLQWCILKELYPYSPANPFARIRESMAKSELYLDIECAYWGAYLGDSFPWHQVELRRIDNEDRPELNRRRVLICQALTSLKRRGLVREDMTGQIFITEQGKEMVKANSLSK